MKSYNMKILLVFICLTCGTLGNQSNQNKAKGSTDLRQLDTVASTKLLILDLIQNLRNAADEAYTAVSSFRSGLQQQAKEFEEKLERDLQSIRNRIEEAISAVADRIIGAGDTVRSCIDGRRSDAESLVNDTVDKIRGCGRERYEEVTSMIDKLSKLTNNATQFTNSSMSSMRDCVDNNGLNVLSLARCLTDVALKAEREGAVFVYQFGVLIARINLSMATLPAALQVCAGSNLVQVGVGTTRILLEIGQCSISSLYSFFTTNDFNSIDSNFL